MSTNAKEYDKEYFEEGTKSSYKGYSFNDEFVSQAHDIKQLFAPLSVLDIGGAKGYLVKALTDIGIESYGIEISHYAIQNVPSEVKSYHIEADALMIPFRSKSFELVTCYDILEHLPDDISDELIDEICRVTKNYIIVRSPYIHEEWDNDITHINIQPKEYWIQKFKKRGFQLAGEWFHNNERPTWHSLIFYNTHIPQKKILNVLLKHGMILETIISDLKPTILKQTEEINRIVNEVEKLQNINLEHQIIEQNLQSPIKEKESQLHEKDIILKEKDSQIASLQQAITNYQKIITDIHQSFVLRMLHKYDNTLGKIIPLRPKKYLKSSQERLTDEEQASNKKKASELIEKKDILCFPIINWDFRYQRPQHIMSEFAKNGHRVFYFTVNLKKLTRPYEIKPISNNIFQVELSSPKFFDIYKDKFDKSLTENILKSFESFQQDLRLDAISFVQFPTWEPLVTELKKRLDYKIVFDCLDDFTGFGNVVKERNREEATLIKNADLVTATSSSLTKKIMKNTSKSLFLPNAGEFAHFNKQSSERLLRDYEKPIVGYFGSIAQWFDNDLIEFVAQKRPHLTFVFIGHTFGSDIRKLSELKNVHFLGERPYSELPKYLQDFDTCLIPFKGIPLIQATHPVKIYEYFSAGKPVVTTNMPELFSMRDLCYISENKEDFLAKLDLALKETDPDLQRKRIEFASKNTWEHRFQKLYAQLNEIPSLNLAEHK